MPTSSWGFFLTGVSDFRMLLGKATIYYGQFGGIFVQMCLKAQLGEACMIICCCWTLVEQRSLAML